MLRNHRLLLGGGLVVLIAGCKYELPDTNLVLGSDTSFTITRAMADSASFPGSGNFNPASCISLPDDWSVVPQATIDNSSHDAPVVQITEQTASADRLQTDLPVSGHVWRCYSAYDTDQPLGTLPSGEVTYTITPTTFTGPVRVMTTLGNSVSNIGGALAAQTIYADALPETHAPHRLAVDGDLIYNNVTLGSQTLSSIVFNSKLIATGMPGANTGVTVLTPQGETATLRAAVYPNSAANFSAPAEGDGRAAVAVTNQDGSVNIFSSADGDQWTTSATGVTLANINTRAALSFDPENNRWILLDTQTPRAYFLSNAADNRFTMDIDNPGPAPALALSTLEDVSGDSALPALVGINGEGLVLARLVGDQWQYDLLSSTLIQISALVGRIEDGTLYLAMTDNDSAQSAFYRHQIGSNDELLPVATLPLFNNANDLLRSGDKLLLATSVGIAISADDGDTWHSLLDAGALPTFQETQGWAIQETRINAIQDNTVLATIKLNGAEGIYGTVQTQTLMDLSDAGISLISGTLNGGLHSDPSTPATVWSDLGRIGNTQYRVAFKMDGSPAVEALSLDSADSQGGDDGGNGDGDGDGDDEGTSGSGGGGSLPLAVIGGLLLAALRRRAAA
ncbi:hypothetical protein CEK62_13745 [Alcanivorax sp. N3-2A]|nr:hypothetical protein CEK62_13745 [Alcanivorax sp. N3-2A]|tara:strand:+ start:13708 stop:15576 length:1869 start_codon:yes stop_codon:yes gene_type:complete